MFKILWQNQLTNRFCHKSCGNFSPKIDFATKAVAILSFEQDLPQLKIYKLLSVFVSSFWWLAMN